jgi:type IV pilus assembly protein PilZ
MAGAGSPPRSAPPSEPPPEPGSERREAERFDVEWAVDCETEDTFLFANITNISALGIFVTSREPLPLGTRLTLRFVPPGGLDPFVLHGEVQWVNPVRLLAPSKNPGMGIRFVDLARDDRARLLQTIRTIAYLRDRAN